jgi:hypothetical protein
LNGEKSQITISALILRQNTLRTLSMILRRLNSLVVIVVALMLHADAGADVVLSFDHNPISDFQVIDQAYGDNVTVSPDGNGHMYDIIPGNGFGTTPNVTVSYGPGDPSLWTTGYGDLTNIYFNDADGDTDLEITFVADAFFEVGLFGFDVASFLAGGQTVQGLHVRDGLGNILWSTGSTAISGTTHNDFDFAGGLFAPTLIINVDLTGLGGVSDDIGIDNVHFVQRSIPEPSATGIFAVAVVAGWMRRRRRVM